MSDDDELPLFQIDGRHFSTLEEFFDEIEAILIPGLPFARTLEAFEDIFRGGHGLPPGGFVFRWMYHSLSKRELGYPETVRLLEKKLRTAHPDRRAALAAELAAARQREGPTVFDALAAILRDWGPGGSHPGGGVVLELE